MGKEIPALRNLMNKLVLEYAQFNKKQADNPKTEYLVARHRFNLNSYRDGDYKFSFCDGCYINHSSYEFTEVALKYDKPELDKLLKFKRVWIEIRVEADCGTGEWKSLFIVQYKADNVEFGGIVDYFCGKGKDLKSLVKYLSWLDTKHKNMTAARWLRKELNEYLKK